MCGIRGTNFNVYLNPKSIKHRGPDKVNTINFEGFQLQHSLLSIVDYVEQPIYDKNHVLLFNGEIYNWQELNKKFNLNAKNDTEVLFKLLKKYNIKQTLKLLDGVYAFAFFWKDKDGLHAYLTRDTIGVKPLWYYYKKKLFFASEKKMFPKKIRDKAIDLNPRLIIYFNFSQNKIKTYYKDFFDKIKEKKLNYAYAKQKINKLLYDAIKKRTPTDKKYGVMLSGGIDSSLIATISKQINPNQICYTVVTDESDDLKYIPYLKDLNIKIIKVTKKEIEKALPKIIKIIETTDPVKVSVATTFYFAAKEAKKDNIKIMLIGNGSDDIFAGYSRFNSNYNITSDSISRLRKLYDTDLYRDDSLFMHFSIETRMPYLDLKLIKTALSLPKEYKITNENKKIILRDIAKKYLPKEIYTRPKKAAQYSSKIDKFISKIAKEHGYKNKSHYLKQFLPYNDTLLGTLYSTGKDSNLALEIMHTKNYKINCLITILSKNKDSYMFQTTGTELVDYQAKALNLPIIKEITDGKKELELKTLKKALKLAKEKYNIGGIITGALYSTYQRDRIEKIADRLGLKVFSPLWHKDQYLEVKEIIAKKIKPIIIKYAAYGFNENFLGKELNLELLNYFKKLNEKIGFNIAGEGGEYETFVIDSPLFKYKIKIQEYEKKIIDSYTAELIIRRIKLIRK